MKNLRSLRKAFTLFELIIVIAIIIIMAGVAAPMTSSYIVERSLYNTAAQIQQDIRLAQHLAITHSTTSKFRIHFDPTNNSYTVETSEDGSEIITRNFNDAYGFPKYFGVNSPPSVYVVNFGAEIPVKELFFDNLGKPHTKDSSGNPYDNECHINLQNSSGSKKIQIIVSVIGRIHITWVQR